MLHCSIISFIENLYKCALNLLFGSASTPIPLKHICALTSLPDQRNLASSPLPTNQPALSASLKWSKSSLLTFTICKQETFALIKPWVASQIIILILNPTVLLLPFVGNTHWTTSLKDVLKNRWKAKPAHVRTPPATLVGVEAPPGDWGCLRLPLLHPAALPLSQTEYVIYLLHLVFCCCLINIKFIDLNASDWRVLEMGQEWREEAGRQRVLDRKAAIQSILYEVAPLLTYWTW